MDLLEKIHFKTKLKNIFDNLLKKFIFG